MVDAADFCSVNKHERTTPAYGPASGPLREALDVFFSNIQRTHNLATIPQLIAGSTRIAEQCECLALVHLHASQANPLVVGLTDRRLVSDAPEFDQGIFDQKEAFRLQYLKVASKQILDGVEVSSYAINESALAHLLDSNDQRLIDGLQSVLQAIVVEVWTAFEILIEMIWNGAIQIKPAFGQGIAFNRNVKHQINPGGKRKTGFRNLDSIRFTYELGFDPSPEIMAILDDPRLLALSSVRNVFAHKSGVVDDGFVKRQQELINEPCFSSFVSVPLGQKILLSGASVRDLKAPAINLGIDLVSEVDLWLTANP